jgi:zinc transport system substrate-binding protein
MNKKMHVVAVFLVACLVIVGVFAYVTYRSPDRATDRRIVVVTILPQAEFVEKVGGEKVAVTVLVPPGAEPHTYEPTPSQLRDVSEAKLYAKVGSSIEFEVNWLDRVIAANPRMLVVDCSKGMELIPMTEHEHEEGNHNEEHSGMDPHIWTSVRNAKIMVENIYEGLVQVDPENEAYYSENKERYAQLLDSLDREMEESISGIQNRKFIVYHPAWGYLAKDYNLEQIAIEEAGKEPTARNLAVLIEEAKKENIKVIFASPQFTEKSAEAVSKEIGGRVVLIDPLAKNYLENMEKVAEALAEGMK